MNQAAIPSVPILVLVILIGYLIGSVPFALVIGKIFYKTDVREHGSGNLGGGNTGRVLGKKAGLSVMASDLLKVTLVVWIAWLLSDRSDLAVSLGGLAAAIGHCYPVFARFKGGKAVAVMYGFLFGLFVVCGESPLLFFLPLAVFLIVLYLTKIIAVASISSAAAVTLYAWFTLTSLPVRITLTVIAVILTVRHHGNIERMIRHEENKIKWM